MTQSIESLDPIYSTNYWEAGIVLQLFDSLLKFDEALAISPALARDWQISLDGKIYTFQLRRGIRFHHGRELTAEDVVYSLSRLLDPKKRAVDAEHYTQISGARDFRAGVAASISGLKALGKYEVQISLDKPFAPFLHLLCLQSAAVVPREEVEKPRTSFGGHPVGSGAFRLTSWSDSEILLEANPAYFQGRAYLDGLRIKTVPALSAEEAFREFTNGNLDLSFVPNDQMTVAQKETKWEFHSRPVLRLLYLGMNVRDPYLRDVQVRKAIALAVDKTALFGGLPDFEITDRLIPFSLLGSSHDRSVNGYNPDAARQALASSRRFHKRSETLELWHATTSEERKQRLKRFQEGFQTIGLNVKLRIVSSLEELLTQIYAGKTQLFLLGEVIDFPDPDALLHRLFNSKSKGNPFGYANEKVDGLLSEARQALDERIRAQLYQQIEQQLLQEFVMVPLCQVKYSFVTTRQLKGVEVSPLGFQYFPFRKVWLGSSESE